MHAREIFLTTVLSAALQSSTPATSPAALSIPLKYSLHGQNNFHSTPIIHQCLKITSFKSNTTILTNFGKGCTRNSGMRLLKYFLFLIFILIDCLSQGATQNHELYSSLNFICSEFLRCTSMYSWQHQRMKTGNLNSNFQTKNSKE